jgi:hypothetical protein
MRKYQTFTERVSSESIPPNLAVRDRGGRQLGTHEQIVPQMTSKCEVGHPAACGAEIKNSEGASKATIRSERLG